VNFNTIRILVPRTAPDDWWGERLDLIEAALTQEA